MHKVHAYKRQDYVIEFRQYIGEGKFLSFEVYNSIYIVNFDMFYFLNFNESNEPVHEILALIAYANNKKSDCAVSSDPLPLP